ncbi:hypothetical protein CAPTEDRAFT_206788 [Capitella teleta]|uniref:LRRCT domain-containing protein n=1 Tax=Capitella teleta TaxID=283909 RepID=R7U660_CAPTE|nr:hypothetical protein CAPTEDRAFT_206788 [Capitella teleta]|eukprot:ELU01439.1 hypothetical protein CAPTEDRAFT_206788 [Capitella teleta]
MEIHLLVWLLCLLNSENSLGVSIWHGGQGLTSIPDNIETSVSELGCSNNNISAITKSDFNDKYPALVLITLKNNEITTVEYGCFKGTALRQIVLGWNLLTVFPDFREVKDTLEYIDLVNNKIPKISRTELDYLTKISGIQLNNNPLVQVPQLTRLLPTLNKLSVYGIELDCCSLTIWLKRKPNTLDLGMNIRPCSYPSTWNATKWESITEGMLLQNTCEVRKECLDHLEQGSWNGLYNHITTFKIRLNETYQSLRLYQTSFMRTFLSWVI